MSQEETVNTLRGTMVAAQLLYPFPSEHVCKKNFLYCSEILQNNAPAYNYVAVPSWPNPNNWALQ